MVSVLFITRKFPPSIGGMQKVAFDLYKSLSKIAEVELVSYGHSQRWLPFILPYLFFRSFVVLLLKKIDIIHLQDGLLSPLGLILKIFRRPIVVTVHGLDITYQNFLYRAIVPTCMGKLDKIICISEATKNECLKRGIPECKIIIIPNGIDPNEYYDPSITKKDLESKLKDEKNLKVDLENKDIILTVGRLVERKGIHWFVENVMPKLVEKNPKVLYFIAGDGPYKTVILQKINLKGLQEHVYMLSRVGNELLKYLYNGSDVMVMPNIPVKGDMEGFGIVALEASSCETPVIASDLEGIKDAVKEGKNGFLVEPRNSKDFSENISKILLDDNLRSGLSREARKFVEEKFSWSVITQKLLDIYQQVLK